MEDEAQVIAEIVARVESSEPIPRATALTWLHSDILEVQGVAEYVLFECGACTRVHPYLSVRDYVDFMMPYYERCLKENPDGEYAPSSFMAGAEIVGGFLHLWREGSTPRELLEEMRDWLERLYREGDAGMRGCLETATLEHLFEYAEIAHFFASWQDDPVLAPGYEAAMEWGRDHERPISSRSTIGL
jgi:hypothetical protein